MSKKILIYYEKECVSAPRLIKQIEALHNSYEIIVASSLFNIDNNKFPRVTHIQLPSTENLNITFHLKLPILFRKFFSIFVKIYLTYHQKKIGIFKQPKEEVFYWNRKFYHHLKLLLTHEFDLIIGHHTSSLVICSKLKKLKSVPFIFNAHEFYSEQKTENEKWVKNTQPDIIYILKNYLTNVDEIFTVGKNIGNEYLSQFSVNQFSVIPNDKPHSNLSPSPVSMPIRLIHHGVASKARKIEGLIEMMGFLPKEKYELTLMLKSNESEYLNNLKELANAYPNVKFVDPVSLDKIIPETNQYDIGVYILHPLNFNHENALPNKFFEFIQAKLCICISPNAEMKSLIDQFDLGKTSLDYTPQSLAKTISNLSIEDVNMFKKNAQKASETLSSNKTKKLISERISFWLQHSKTANS